MGLEQGGISPSGKPLETSHLTPPERGYSGLKIPRREFLSLSLVAALDAVGFKATSVKAEDQKPESTTVMVDGNPVEISGIQTGGESIKPEPAGGKTEDGYAWEDGKRVIVDVSLTLLRLVDFDQIPTESLEDINTGQDRPALPLHTELRNYIDTMGADTLSVNNKPSLPEMYASRQRGVGVITVNRAGARQNPEAAFVYMETMIKPLDASGNPTNNIELNFFFNPNCPTPPKGDTVINMGGEDVVVPDVYKSFLGFAASDLAQSAWVFGNTPPNTRLTSDIAPGYESGSPLSRLVGNMDKLLPFQMIV